MYDFIRFDADVIRSEAIERFEAESGETLYNGDERLMLIDTMMYVAQILANNANFMANNQLKKTAVSPYLEQIGEDEKTPIFEAQQARVTEKFELSLTYGYDVTIPAGTRVTADGEVFFATDEEGVISAGQSSIELLCTATTAGKKASNLAANTINVLVDSIPEVTKVTNINSSYGGTDREDIEDYRERLLGNQASYSVAGPTEAYVYHAKAVDAVISDVKVDENKTGGVVPVYVYCHGELPEQGILDKVEAALSKKTIRPLTDSVRVLAPDVVEYEIDVSYMIDENIIDVEPIKKAVEASIQDYISYQEEKIGRHINPDKLRKYMLNAGADRVIIRQPVFKEIGDYEVAQLSGEPVISYS